MEATRRICSDLLLACGCVQVYYLDSIVDKVKVDTVWCEEHSSEQRIIKVGEPYRDYGNHYDRSWHSPTEELPMFKKL